MRPIPAILFEQAWSVKELLHGFQGNGSLVSQGAVVHPIRSEYTLNPLVHYDSLAHHVSAIYFEF